MGFKGLQGLKRFTGEYEWLYRVTKGSWGLQGVTRGYRRLKRVTSGYKEF